MSGELDWFEMENGSGRQMWLNVTRALSACVSNPHNGLFAFQQSVVVHKRFEPQAVENGFEFNAARSVCSPCQQHCSLMTKNRRRVLCFIF